MPGWDACIYDISKQIAPLTSAKAIKDLIKAKVGEADGRMEKMREMSTPVDNEVEGDNGRWSYSVYLSHSMDSCIIL